MAKKGTLWVTDCVMMTNCNKLVLSTNSRELMFYDISTTLYTCQFRLHGNLFGKFLAIRTLFFFAFLQISPMFHSVSLTTAALRYI